MGSIDRGSRATQRYSTGWRSAEQDSRPGRSAGRCAAANDFVSVRDKCLAEGRLWEDPAFPADDRSILITDQPTNSFEWKRPGELCEQPHMVEDGTSRFDINQGDLGNCWFLASVASLCASGNRGNSKLIERIVPKDNLFVDKYAGVFHFNFWQYGKWVEILVDDRLPTRNGQLIYMHSTSSSEFWSALLEKAYAKLNGSYEALRGGCASEAMEDFTGGVSENYDVRKGLPPKFGKILLKAHERCSLMSCTIDCVGGAIENILPNGLVIGHAYSLTSVIELNYQGHPVVLVRVRNPWGNQYEWKGAWSDSSSEWTQVSESDRKSAGMQEAGNDGEFWMSLDDFLANFHKIEICHLSPDHLTDELSAEGRKKWETTIHEGSWTPRVCAGGCRNFLDTYWTNPQYRVHVIDADDEDDEDAGTVIVGLMQKERRKKMKEGLGLLTLGYSIYKLKDDSSGQLGLDFFKYNRAEARSVFSNVREVSTRHRLAPGHYAIIPCTFKPNEEADFMVRVFSEKPAATSEVDEETSCMDEDEINQHENALRQASEQCVATNATVAESGPPGGQGQRPLQSHEIEPTKRMLRVRQVTEDDVAQERQVRQIFKEASGDDMQIDAFELKEILNGQFSREFKFDGFALETCRSMVAMMDMDKSGMLGYEEFKTLWNNLRRLKKIFKEFDRDNSGNLNSFELREALNAEGIKVSNATFNGLVMRYSDRNGHLRFNEFILCAVRIKSMFDVFKDVRSDNSAKFTMDQFIQITMYS